MNEPSVPQASLWETYFKKGPFFVLKYMYWWWKGLIILIAISISLMIPSEALLVPLVSGIIALLYHSITIGIFGIVILLSLIVWAAIEASIWLIILVYILGGTCYLIMFFSENQKVEKKIIEFLFRPFQIR